MFRRVLCYALLAVILPVFSSTVGAAPPAKASPSARTAPSRKTPTATATRSKTKSKRLPASETVTTKQIDRIFSWAARQKDIAYRYPADGCYARAHLLVRRLQKAGYKPFKVWSQQNGEPLYVRTRNHPKGYVTWKYHVAPILRVRFNSGEQAWYVIDPSLFSRPVMVSTWRDVQRRPGSRSRPFVTVTRVGTAPLNPQRLRLRGSGYWLGSDPGEGADAHALRTMRRYKPYEGKLPPRSFAAADDRGGPDIDTRPTELVLAAREELPTE
jgi:hypothetical protein